MKSVPLRWHPHPSYPPAVRERLPEVESIAQANIDAINQRIGPERNAQWEARLNALIRSREPVWVRLRALYALAGEAATYYQDNVACRRGCAHCCYIGVGALKPDEFFQAYGIICGFAKGADIRQYFPRSKP